LGARRAWRAAPRLLPEDPGPSNMIGQILRMQGDIDGSKLAFAEGARIKKKKEAEQINRLREKKEDKAEKAQQKK
jgi:hypothetical protein